MRILFDQGTPVPLRAALSGHTVATAYQPVEKRSSDASSERIATGKHGRGVRATVFSTDCYERGWPSLQNGELLAAAESHFDVFVTTDKSLRYQQNLAGRQLAILVLPFASWPRLSGHVATIAAAVDALRAGDFIELALDQT